ncbi:MAG: hypothetical protein FWF82_07530 [Oscillospiraceae bacterium]|nr:hypothetical protein [Oscillospiraceae bacterium]
MMNRLINDMNLSDIPYERVSEYIKLEQAQDIKNTASNVEKISKNIGIIKNCVVFFTVMSAIGIVAAVIGFLLS